MNHIIRRVATLCATIAILGATLGGTALADNQPTTSSANSSVSVTLPAGGSWAAYTFWYSGLSAVDDLSMTYSPADLSTDQYVTFLAYAPGVVPAGNNTIGAGTLFRTPGGIVQSGLKTWQLTAVDPGTYTVMVQNWDSMGRHVTANLSSIDVVTGGAGPALTLIGTSTGVTATGTSAPAPAAPVATAPAAPAPAPAAARGTTATVTLKPGVTLTHYRASVSGYGRTQEIWKLAWTLGNSHVKLSSRLLGRYHPSNETVDVAKISSLAGTPGLVAALNGDFSAYTTPTAYRNSGILVRKRRIYNFGWGGNGVGYLPNGNFVMGHPTAHSTQMLLPNNQAATVGAWNAACARARLAMEYVVNVCWQASW